MVYKTDYHVHSTFSDGRSAPEDYIKPAIAAGLSEIGFSEHLTLFKDLEDWNMNPANILPYINCIESLKSKTKTIRIKTGLEVDFFAGKEEEIRNYLNPLPLDYIIGSVHYLGEKTVDVGPEFYEGKSIDRLFESYLDSVAAAVSSGLFDIIGHCDLIRIYGYKPVSNQEPFYRKLAKTMKIKDVAFELNTNGRNRPLADFYPDRKFLTIFREENIPVCVNSDAHMPSRVGQYFDEAYELLRYVGFTEMAIFDKRVRQMVPF
ncbi:MAG: histidinol-phosphatase HisJ family protein [Bacteroidetes bacterium]|nr:MAG: histidinol-phosphatase HisJ family protein [Bacteroidota bacterium]